jgi:hypothetical protein
MSTRPPAASAVGVVVAAAALLFVLAGCSALPLPGSVPTSSSAVSAQPAVGQCWNASVAQATEWAAWDGHSAVPCAMSHRLYTYEVGHITGETGSTWASSANGSSLSAAVAAKADHACTISTLLPSEKWNQQLIQQYFFVPSQAEWAAGARWVRCDVGVLSTGTTLADERFSALPKSISTFVAAVASDPRRYEFCLNSSQPVTDVGPLDNPDATLADCDKSPEWTLATHANLPGASGAAFPSDSTANAESAAICSRAATGAGQIWIAYLPTRSDWEAGDREVDCWVGQKQLPGGQAA